MSDTLAEKIRAVLSANPTGMTTRRIAEALQEDQQVVHQTLRGCDWVYVSHWIDPPAIYGGEQQVWKSKI